MTNVLILGAGGRTARRVIDLLAGVTGCQLTLFARDTDRIAHVPDGARVVTGDALDREALSEAITGQDIVFAALAGEVDEMAEGIITAMTAHHVDRLIFIAGLGIYDEVPGEFGERNRKLFGGYLTPYREAADMITDSALDYTILRPAWFIDGDDVDYEVTHRGEEFRGRVVTRQSVADVVASIVANPTRYSRDDIGISKPGSDELEPVLPGEEKRGN